MLKLSLVNPLTEHSQQYLISIKLPSIEVIILAPKAITTLVCYHPQRPLIEIGIVACYGSHQILAIRAKVHAEYCHNNLR
jgi:hypothetical protein